MIEQLADEVAGKYKDSQGFLPHLSLFPDRPDVDGYQVLTATELPEMGPTRRATERDLCPSSPFLAVNVSSRARLNADGGTRRTAGQTAQIFLEDVSDHIFGRSPNHDFTHSRAKSIGIAWCTFWPSTRSIQRLVHSSTYTCFNKRPDSVGLAEVGFESFALRWRCVPGTDRFIDRNGWFWVIRNVT